MGTLGVTQEGGCAGVTQEGGCALGSLRRVGALGVFVVCLLIICHCSPGLGFA